jgi:hypothetical protein
MFSEELNLTIKEEIIKEINNFLRTEKLQAITENIKHFGEGAKN